MSFWGTVGGWMWGVDVDAEAERAAELSAKVKSQNDRALAEGKWTIEQYELAEANRLGMDVNEEYDPNLWKDAAAGAAEGLSNMQSTVRETVTSAAGWTLKGVFGWLPVWVWLLVIAWGAWQLGLLKKLPFKL